MFTRFYSTIFNIILAVLIGLLVFSCTTANAAIPSTEIEEITTDGPRCWTITTMHEDGSQTVKEHCEPDQ